MAAATGTKASASTQGRIRVGIRLVSNGAPATKKTSWSKRAAFSVLVLLGLAFWIPPLLRATVSDEAAGGSGVADAPVGDLSDGHDANASRSEAGNTFDPLRAVTDTVGRANSSGAAAEPIVLTTTILGKSRRAAVVNGRLHREGDRISAAGEFYRLTSVAEDRIELLRDGKDLGGDRHLIVRMTAQRHGAK
jgi:hypothetical protein